MVKRKEDLRIIKTRAALSSAFFKMLADMRLDEITVNDLCERSGVRRATFYKHFKDKDDFILFIIKDVRNHFDINVWKQDVSTTVTKEYYLQYTESLLDFFLKHENAIKRIISDPIRSALINVFVQQNFEDTKKRLAASVKNGMKLATSLDVAASILIGGTAHCIVQWFESENRCSKEELLYDIAIITDKILI